MLKKLLRQPVTIDEIFPLQKGAVTEVNSTNKEAVFEIKSIAQMSHYLLENTGFMQELAALVTANVLQLITEKYNFEPTETYKDEIANKKKYINQLDEYLKERKEINKTVENDLQQFLSDTTKSLNTALESFNQNINSRIHEAEHRYGIDAIKEVLLSNKDK
jgi:hypothetical protein